MFQSYREPPPEFDHVAYFSFEDIRKDLGKVRLPWCITETLQKLLNLQLFWTVLSSCKLFLKVTLVWQLQPMCLGYLLHTFPLTLNTRLNTFLLDLREKSVCTGITEDVLQNFASLPDGTGSKQYFRYIINLPANVMFFHISCIMSNSWQLLLPTTQDSHNMCSNCSHVEKTRNARYQRPEQKSLQHDTIKSNYPLHSVTGHQMK